MGASGEGGEADLGLQAACGQRVGVQVGSVRGGDGGGDGQSEPQAVAVDSAVAGQSLEGLEQPLDFGGEDDGAGVGDPEGRPSGDGVGDDLDVAAGPVGRTARG